MRSWDYRFVTLAAIALFAFGLSAASNRTTNQAEAVPAAKNQHATAMSNEHPATLAQLMRGIMFPNSNLIFAAQGKNPVDVPPAKNPSNAINPLEGTYGKWEAVENSSLVIVEAADLLTVPTRACSNGRPVPAGNPDWPRLVQGLRDAGMKSYRAAQSKDQDKITDAADALTTACSNCHVKYRDKPTLEDRCR
jgi:hypothetical protein